MVESMRGEMMAVTRAEIEEKLQQLSPEQLASVYDFVSFLAARRDTATSLATMRASEPVPRRDWDRPEEDLAWPDLEPFGLIRSR
jgi:hypothetical protein